MDKPREEGHHAVNEEGVYMEDMIMELELGRPLAEDEVVFHRNHDTLDNRRQNLVVYKFGIDMAKPEGGDEDE